MGRVLLQKVEELPRPSLSHPARINKSTQAGEPLQYPALTWAITSWDQMSEAKVRCALLSPSEGLSSVGPKTVARLWRDILLIGSFSATLWGTGREAVSAPNDVQEWGAMGCSPFSQQQWGTSSFPLPLVALGKPRCRAGSSAPFTASAGAAGPGPEPRV